jgi:hypothetical protein
MSKARSILAILYDASGAWRIESDYSFIFHSRQARGAVSSPAVIGQGVVNEHG